MSARRSELVLGPFDRPSKVWTNAVRAAPASLTAIVGATGLLLRASGVDLDLALAALGLAVVWTVLRREPFLLGALVCLGIELVRALTGLPYAERVLITAAVGMLFYGIHAAASLDAALRSPAPTETSVIQRWALSSVRIVVVGAVVGGWLAFIADLGPKTPALGLLGALAVLSFAAVPLVALRSRRRPGGPGASQ